MYFTFIIICKCKVSSFFNCYWKQWLFLKVVQTYFPLELFSSFSSISLERFGAWCTSILQLFEIEIENSDEVHLRNSSALVQGATNIFWYGFINLLIISVSCMWKFSMFLKIIWSWCSAQSCNVSLFMISYFCLARGAKVSYLWFIMICW